MTIRMRMPSQTLSEIHRDFNRPHAFALERVGFLLCGAAALQDGGTLITSQQWISVADDHYINDPRAGATIGAAAFRRVLELAYNSPSTILHVHRHEHRGIPRFSRTDVISMNDFVQGFFHACSTHPHGAVVLSHDAAAGSLWLRKGTRPAAIRQFDFVGQPLHTRRSV